MNLMPILKSAANNNTLYSSLIKGQIRHKGMPISCEVLVLSRNTKQVLSKSMSDADGVFIAHGSHLYPNIVMATDPYGDHNVAAQDNVK